MNKLLGGGLAVAFTAAGTMLLAGPGGAEIGGVPEATIAPTAIHPGQTVTVTGDQCGSVDWGIFLESDPVGTPAFDGATGVSASGGLNISWTAPVAQAPGTYSIQVTCNDDGDDYIVQGSGVLDEEGNLIDGNIDFRFDLVATPDTEAPPTTTPPPAPARPGRPSLTG